MDKISPLKQRSTSMDENGGSKITSIRQIVKIKEILKKWQVAALSPKNTQSKRGGISPEVTWRLQNCDSDDDSRQSVEIPSDVPKGYLAVYVGPEHRRFIISTSYLSDPLFKKLLEKVEEEFGFDHRGGLTIPCEIETFKALLQCMEKERKKKELDRSNAGETSSPS